MYFTPPPLPLVILETQSYVKITGCIYVQLIGQGTDCYCIGGGYLHPLEINRHFLLYFLLEVKD